MNQTEKLCNKYKVDLNSFDSAKENYYQDCCLKNIDLDTFNPMTFENEIKRRNNSERAKKSFDTLCDRFYDLICICARESKVQENGDLFCNDLTDRIPKVQFSGENTKITITIGLFRRFYLITKLEHTNNLKYMPDKFWEQLFRLSDYGKFEFKEEHKPPTDIRKKHPHLFNKRGSVYKLMRNYFLNETEYEYTNSLGYLSVEWENNTKFEDMFLGICESFKIMYNLNHMLWEKENRQLNY